VIGFPTLLNDVVERLCVCFFVGPRSVFVLRV